MNYVSHLRCLICGRHYGPEELDYVCPLHGNEGVLDVCCDYDRLSNSTSRDRLEDCDELSMWRYSDLLPVEPDAELPPLSVGWTPMQRIRSVEASLGLAQVWIKDEGRQPTASLKDRASALAVVKARQLGAETITTASSGNAAAALSGLCASVGQKNVIFVPASAPPAKITQLLVYGSTVMLVRGSYDDAFELCLQASAEYGWYNRSTAYNPYMSEGKKTAAFEISEQLDWTPPDAVLVSVGDGCIIGGLHKGFSDLWALGWIKRMPRLIGVQAEGSDYLTEAWEKDQDVLTKPPIHARTAADSICVGLPRDRVKAMAAVRETGGAFIRLSDERILSAIPTLARSSGIFAEPAGAAAFAGLEAAIEGGHIQAGERIVVLNTGNGLKDVAGAATAVERTGNQAHPVDPSMEHVRRVVEEFRARR